MEDEVSKQLEQVQKDIAALEQRVVLRDAPDRDAISRLKEEKLAYSSQISSASQTEVMLEQERLRAAGRLSEVETREARLGTMGTVERLVVAGWSFVFIALALLLVFDLTLLVVRNVLWTGLLAALVCAILGWGLAIVVRRTRRG
jgi:hypothetical protein